MKLPVPNLSPADSLAEFDLWVTATLGQIRDTERFQEALEQSCRVMDILEEATNGFRDVAECHPDAIGSTVVDHISPLEPDAAEAMLEALAALLYLVTARSDNNGKCQFPLYLRDKLHVTKLPKATRTGVSERNLPRVMDVDKYMGWVVELDKYPERQRQLLQLFIDFVLSGSHAPEQLWAIGNSYHHLKGLGKHRELLSPLVVFQIRGSVAASGGHDPERLLRDEMATWGMEPGTDVNQNDVSIAEIVGEMDGGNSGKTRKFDFALPFRTSGWVPRILIQCQFYAGDSGSVSHKNVDQTPTGREAARKRFSENGLPPPYFVEYVDGAGYFASLNGDLRHLLQFSDTRSFTQIRSAPIRLRRELQHIGFLTRLEIDHALLRANMDKKRAKDILSAEGYTQQEVQRLEHQFLTSLPQERRHLARRYLLLDLCAAKGTKLKGQSLAGSVLCPGYGPFWGMKIDDLSDIAIQEAPSLQQDWANAQTFLGDIRWLCEKRFVSLV